MLFRSGAVAFPHGVDIRAKTYALEQARLTLWLICPDHLRSDYYYGKESTLVRVVINHANSDYMPDINRVLSMHKLKCSIAGSAVPDNMAVESYSDEWLPSWSDVKETLEQTYEALSKDKVQRKEALPSMALAACASVALEADTQESVDACQHVQEINTHKNLRK